MEQLNCSQLGQLVWWYFRNIKITRSWFKEALDAQQFNGAKYARPHPMRSALSRSLELLAESRIIRKVSEDNIRLVYQFTNETLVNDTENPTFEYVNEAVIHISKEIWNQTSDFKKSITKCPEELKDFLADKFEIAKETFDSNDVTRYVKNILETEADIVSVRDGGSIYFCPAAYCDVIARIDNVLKSIPKENGSAKMDYLIIPDIESSRELVSENVTKEISAILNSIDNDICELSGAVTKIWVTNRQKTIEITENRIKLYANIVKNHASMINKCNELKKNLTTVEIKEL